MRAQPVDLIGGYYKDDSLPWSAQDTVNWLPVMAEVAGTRTVKKFSTPPGLKPWQKIGTGPIRGMHDCEGLRLIVSGRYLFRITPTGVGVPIGVIPGVGRVQMTHNQFKTGFQVLIENGQGGGGYVYTTSTDTFAKITDEGYPGSISSDYLDSYILGVEPQGRFWFHSNLADATDYNTLDRYEAEAAPDRIVGLATNASEVVVFGQRTVEFYFNSGAATGTFQNRKSSIARGCASRHTIQKLDNTLFWLGDDGVVYRLGGNGYSATPVSTRPLEKAISEFNWPEAVAYVWEDRGHKVYYLTFPDGQTFGYDVITGLWHRRESYGLNRWRLSHIIPWGRDWFGGDFQNGRLWQLDWDYYLEGDQPIVSERVSPALADDQSQLIVPNAELIFDTGNGPGTEPIPFPAQPVPPSISGDAPGANLGEAYSYAYTISAGDAPIVSINIGSGSLPAGLTLSSAGVISGTPTQPQISSFSVVVKDASGIWTEIVDKIQVAPVWVAVYVSGNVYAYGLNNGRDWNHPSRSAIAGGSKAYSLAMTSGARLALVTSTNTGAYSDNYGATFVESTGLSLQSAGAAIYDGSAFIIARNARVINYSTTGIAYQTVTVANSYPNDGTGNFTCIASNGSRAVCCASRSSVSLDHGATWSALTNKYVFPAAAGASSGPSARGIATNGPVFVAVGDGNNISRSSDGITWESLTSPFTGTSAITAVTYASGRWIIGNSDGRIAYGSDASSLQISSFVFGSSVRAINSFAGVTVIGGTGARMAYSENGSDWTILTTQAGSSATFTSIATPMEAP